MPQHDDRAWNELEHPQSPLADESGSEGGGGGGTPGATMTSRIVDVLPTLDAAQAADTGGVAIDPIEIVPLTSIGEIHWAGSQEAASDLPEGAAGATGQVVPPSSKDLSHTGDLREEAMPQSVHPRESIGPEDTVTADTPGYLGEYEP